VGREDGGKGQGQRQRKRQAPDPALPRVFRLECQRPVLSPQRVTALGHLEQPLRGELFGPGQDDRGFLREGHAKEGSGEVDAKGADLSGLQLQLQHLGREPFRAHQEAVLARRHRAQQKRGPGLEPLPVHHHLGVDRHGAEEQRGLRHLGIAVQGDRRQRNEN
jgi:hypothetical protein